MEQRSEYPRKRGADSPLSSAHMLWLQLSFHKLPSFQSVIESLSTSPLTDVLVVVDSVSKALTDCLVMGSCSPPTDRQHMFFMWPSVYQVAMVMRSFCGSGATQVTPHIYVVTVTCVLCDFVGLFCAYDVYCKSVHHGRTISALWPFLSANVFPWLVFFPCAERGSGEREILT